MLDDAGLRTVVDDAGLRTVVDDAGLRTAVEDPVRVRPLEMDPVLGRM